VRNLKTPDHRFSDITEKHNAIREAYEQSEIQYNIIPVRGRRQDATTWVAIMYTFAS